MDASDIEKRTSGSIFERFISGEPVPMNDPQCWKVRKAVERTRELSNCLNKTNSQQEIRMLLSEVIGEQVYESTVVFTPFHTNFGRHITLGKNVLINHSCSPLDLGGITVEDEVMIRPFVSISSENHPVKVADRKTWSPRQ